MKRPRVIAVAGAKGGTGKSMIAANIGVFLASLGKDVVLIDAAFGSANLHSFVGVNEPRRSLADFLSRDDGQLSDVVVSTLISKLGLIAGESDPAWASNPRVQQLSRLRQQIREVDADYVILDLPPGTRETVLDLYLDADVGLVVTSPEPTAVEMVYRFIKAAFVRRLRRSELGHLAKMTMEEAHEYEGGIAAPSDLLARTLARYDEESEEVAAFRHQMASMIPYLVLNTARSKADMDLGKDVARAATRRFGLPISYLGPVEYDDAVWVSLRRRRPLLVEHPESRASKCVEKLTRRLLGLESDNAKAPDLPGESHYDLLDVAPTASDEIVRRANRRIRQVYAQDSVVVGGLYGRSRLDRLHRRLDDAYDTLMDPAKRRTNDQMMFPDGVPSQPQVQRLAVLDRVAAFEECPDRPKVDDGTVYTGALLQEFREASGLELREIADRTKIGITYLTAIEGESYEELPAVVYVRGFLREYAKILRLDGERVLDTYLRRLSSAKAEIVAE